MSERIVNTRYNLRRTAHVRARSAPSSPEAVAKGKDTPADVSRLYSDIVKAKDSVPSRASDECPGLRKTSPEYPDGQRSSEAIIARELATVRNSDTPTVKGIPGSALTSVYSTPAPEESETNGDDRGGWTTVAKKSRLGSPARENRRLPIRKDRRESPVKGNPNKSRLGPEQEQTVEEAIKKLTKDQRQKISERQRVVSITGVKKPGTKSTSTRGEGPSNLKGKGPDPRNWGTLSACEDELDLEAQREALASWKTVQELARSEQESKPDLSAKGTESNVEAQRAAIASWNKAHELAKSVSTNVSDRALSPESQNGRVRSRSVRAFAPKIRKGPVEVLSPKDKKTAENKNQKLWKAHKGQERPTRKTPDPVRAIVDKAIAQDKSRHKRHKTPRAMEPVEQVDPKSYIGLAFKRLGGKDRRTHQSSSDSSSNSSSNKSSSSSERKRRRKKKGRKWSSSSSSKSSDSSTETDVRSSDSEESLSDSSSSSSSSSDRRRKRRSRHSQSRGRGGRKTKKSRSKRHKSRR